MKTIKTNIGDLFIWFGNRPGMEKITIGGLSPGVHYTIMYRNDKQVFDVHKTIELGKRNKKSYEQLLEMRLFTFKRLLLSCRNIIPQLLYKVFFSRIITLDNLQQQNMILAPFAPDESKTEFFVNLETPKKMRFANEIDPKLILESFIYPDQIIRPNENAFWVYSNNYGRQKIKGFIFRPNILHSTDEFYFVSVRSFQRHIQKLQDELIKILNNLDFKHRDAVVAMIDKLGAVRIEK